MTMKRRKFLTFSALFVLLAQIIIMAVSNITAIAVTQQPYEKELFHNDLGWASLSYAPIDADSDHVMWTLKLNKESHNPPTRFALDLTDRNGQTVVPDQLTVTENSNPDLVLGVTDLEGNLVGGLQEQQATGTLLGSTMVTFVTAGDLGSVKAVPHLWEVPAAEATADKATADDAAMLQSAETAVTEPNSDNDLLAGNPGVSIEVKVEPTQESSATTETSDNTETTTESSQGEVSESTTEDVTGETVSSTETETTHLGDADDAAFEAAKKAAEARNAENGKAQLITRSAAVQEDKIDYKNIVPTYTTDNSGIYPENSWVPNGNENVKNHQGGTSAGWDKVTNWDGSAKNDTSSYIEYGGEGETADFAIRKYAKETDTPGLFDVFLNVRGNVKKKIEPLNIVLVVDWSGSMKNNDRVEYAKTGVKNFLDEISKSGISDKVSLGYVGYSSEGRGYTNFSVGLKNFSTAKKEIETNIAKYAPNGGTFTQKALRDAGEMLTGTTGRNVIVLLTDGVPTFSYKVTSAVNIDGEIYGTNFGTGTDRGGDTAQIQEYSVGNLSIKDTYPATLGEAKLIKDRGIEIHGLGIQLSNDKSYMTAKEVEEKMKKIVTTNTDGTFYYESAESASEISDYLTKKAVQLTSTISDGTVSDPVGEQFLLDKNSVEVSRVTSSTAILPTLEISNDNGLISLKNLNLGKGQEIQLHYQLHINTEDENFVPNKWYQMNGQTTLIPNGNNPSNEVDFGIPSGKAPGTQISIKKIWEEFDGDKTGRTDVSFSIARNGVEYGTVKMDKQDGHDTWEQSFDSIQISNKTVWLPEFDNSGKDFTYTVTKETDVPAGYESIWTGDNNTWTNKKIFTKLGLEIIKSSDDSEKTLLSGAEFILKGNGLPDDGVTLKETKKGHYVLPDNYSHSLDRGQTYSLEEKKAPDGYRVLDKPITIEIKENGVVSVVGSSVDQILDNWITGESPNKVIEFAVKNTPKVPLPATGGSGIWLILLTGGIAVTAAGIYFLRRKDQGVA